MLARLLGLTEERQSVQPDGGWGVWPGDSVSTWSGVTVNAESSIQLLAVYGCVQFIAQGVSTLPVDVYRELPDGTKVEIEEPDWLKNPTVDLTFIDWATQVLTSLLLHGNAYVAVIRNDRSVIRELIPIEPSKIRVARENGRKRYYLDGFVYPGELLHIKGVMMPGSDVGLSPLENARQSIGLGLAAVEFGSRLFDGEANMPGVIELPGAVDPTTMRQMAELWARRRNRRNRGMPGVLSDGAQWKTTAVSPEQAQFLATRKFTSAEIASQVYLVDPTEMGMGIEGQSLTYTNAEERGIRKATVTFLPWIRRLEEALSALMFSPRYVKLNIDGLLRGDSTSRWTINKTAMDINVQAAALGMPPVKTTAEMREHEDWSPVDEVFMPPTPEPTTPADPAAA